MFDFVITKLIVVLRRSPLVYGVLFALLPIALALAVGPLVGFGPCGPSVPGSVRVVVIVTGLLAVSSPFVGSWLFWLSFPNRKAITASVALPLVSFSVFICLYWLAILISAVMI
jgi:hypothetical protein